MLLQTHTPLIINFCYPKLKTARVTQPNLKERNTHTHRSRQSKIVTKTQTRQYLIKQLYSSMRILLIS